MIAARLNFIAYCELKCQTKITNRKLSFCFLLGSFVQLPTLLRVITILKSIDGVIRSIQIKVLSLSTCVSDEHVAININYRLRRFFQPLAMYQSQNNSLCSNWSLKKLRMFLIRFISIFSFLLAQIYLLRED